jgi:hypothetical protein
MWTAKFLTFALLAPGALASALHPARRQSSLSSYIKSESSIAFQGVLDNIGADGSKVSGASSGVVVASPSKVNPDCEFPKKENINYWKLTIARLLHLDSGCSSDLEGPR